MDGYRKGTSVSQYTAPNLRIDGPNGSTYAYRRFGRTGTTPVIFLQHFRGNLDGWDPDLVDPISAEREVVLYDPSGIGLSTGAIPDTFRDFARDALTFIDTLGFTQVDIFGFSIGGMIAQEVALQRPALIRRLILAGTGPEGGRNMHGWTDIPRAHAMKDEQGAEDILYLFFAPTPDSQAKGGEFVGRIFTRTDDRDALPSLAVRDAQAAAAIEWGIKDYSRLARLENILQPTLVANGDNDIMVPTENSYLLAGHLPNARLSIYPNANHGFLFQYPTEFAAEVNAFLSE
ncbi:alpha/beta hydrolase [Leifsonia sp. Root1293]|nr:alpha/beta hydrolase [Leifsonia sp. Root1293]KRA12032.1 alpha/beta hydrolase [Leifsonia sp. Root60]